MAKKKKTSKKRPISRKFWNYLHLIPAPLRSMFIRSQFEASYEVMPGLTFKVAETESELRQAMHLVHGVYVELNYIDAKPSGLHLNKYLALPTTFYLVAKLGEEVVGTISIIPDSDLKLPADLSWNLEKYRKKTSLIGEVSSLAIKKSYKLRRGRLLLYLCKLMYTVAKEIMKLDGIVIATTAEVEPFYTDVLLFEKVPGEVGKRHSLVKGNPSSCCFLDLRKAEEKYKKVYGSKDIAHNLHHFFVTHRAPQLFTPDRMFTIQEILYKKNNAMNSILQKHPDLTAQFEDFDHSIIKHYDIFNQYQYNNNPPKSGELYHLNKMSSLRIDAWVFPEGCQQPVKAVLCYARKKVLTIFMEDTQEILDVREQIFIAFQLLGEQKTIKARVVQIQSDKIFNAEALSELPQPNIPDERVIPTLRPVSKGTKNFSP